LKHVGKSNDNEHEELEEIIDSIMPHDRVHLAIKFGEKNKDHQAQLDVLLKQFVKLNSNILFETYKK